MEDPRLNSVHLEAPRRQDYRRAREALLRARGNLTFCAEIGAEHFDESPSPTLIQNDAAPDASLHLDCWLSDGEYIYPLKVGLNTLGRSSDNDVIVADGFTSRRHCVIVVHARRGCELHDTASKNGTLLNGAKVAGPMMLKSGDAIRVCERQFIFVCRGAPRPAPASPDATL